MNYIKNTILLSILTQNQRNNGASILPYKKSNANAIHSCSLSSGDTEPNVPPPETKP